LSSSGGIFMTENEQPGIDFCRNWVCAGGPRRLLLRVGRRRFGSGACRVVVYLRACGCHSSLCARFEMRARRRSERRTSMRVGSNTIVGLIQHMPFVRGMCWVVPSQPSWELAMLWAGGRANHEPAAIHNSKLRYTMTTQAEEVKAMDNEYVMHTYARLPVVFVQGTGALCMTPSAGNIWTWWRA